LAEWHEKESETCYRGGYHPERDGGGRLWPRYTCSPAGRFGSGGADRNPYCRIEADMDTDADRKYYLHVYCVADIYCHCYTDTDGDA